MKGWKIKARTLTEKYRYHNSHLLHFFRFILSYAKFYDNSTQFLDIQEKEINVMSYIFIYAYYILTKYKPQLYLLLAEKADLSKLTYYTQYQQWIEGKLTI